MHPLSIPPLKPKHIARPDGLTEVTGISVQ